MTKPVVYGPAYSTYARTVRLALEEKGADYDLVEVDILQGAGKSPEHLARHPFGKVPAFEHDGLALFETDAITRYVNEAFPGPDLEPGDPRSRAVMTQAIGVVGNYAYPCVITGIFVQRAVMPMLGETTDEAVITAALPQAETCVGTLDRLAGGGPYLAGDALSRADLFLIPVYDYLARTPEGDALLAGAANLRRWWDGVRARPSVERTRPALG